MGAYDDSVAKELHLRFMQQSSTDEHGIPTYELFELVENDRIESESMSMTMGVLEGTQFQLGSYVVPEMSITFSYNGNRYKDKYVRVWINEENDSIIHGLIFGKVYQEVLSENRDKITVTIRNIFYDVFSTYVDWNKTFFAGVPKNTEGQVGLQIYMRTIEDFYRMLYKRTICYGCNVYDTSKFQYVITNNDIQIELANLENYYADYGANDDYIIKYISQLNDTKTTYSGNYPYDDNTTFSLGDIWKWFGELSGVHWVIPMPQYSNISDVTADTIQYGKDVFISPVRILSGNLLYPSDDLYPGSLSPMYGDIIPLPNIDNAISTIPYYVSCQYDETIRTKYSAVKYDNSAVFVIINNVALEEAKPFIFNGGNIFFDKGSRNYQVTYSGQAGGYNYYYRTTPLPQEPNAAFDEHIKRIEGAINTDHYGNSYSQYLYNLDKITYAVLDCVFDPSLQIGQCVSITTQDDLTLCIPLISCQINGINLLKATYRTTAIAEN